MFFCSYKKTFRRLASAPRPFFVDKNNFTLFVGKLVCKIGAYRPEFSSAKLDHPFFFSYNSLNIIDPNKESA
jgi:hypothetical protein